MSQDNNLDPAAYQAQMPIGGGMGATTVTGTGLPAGYIPPPRLQTAGPSGRTSVSGLVASDNMTVRPFYQPTRDAATELAKLDDITRTKVQRLLYAKGWYGSRKPGNGFSDADRGAMADLLLLSNAQGYTWDTLLNKLGQAPTENLAGVGATRPSSADLTEVLQRTALETMGKKLDDASVSQLVSSYQGVYSGSSMESAPQADTFFKQRIESQYGTETDAHKYLGAISNVANILGSL
jgi:hypothetical protein